MQPVEKSTFQRKEDVMSTLELIESCYDRSSPRYKFAFVFNNLLSNGKVVPVTLHGCGELNQRILKQKEVVERLNGNTVLSNKVRELKLRTKVVKNKLEECVDMVRRRVQIRGDVVRLRIAVTKIGRGPIGISNEKKAKIMAVLRAMNSRLRKIMESTTSD